MTATRLPSKPAKKLMTADEFWDFCQRPDNQGKSYELIRGEVIEMCRPNARHGNVSGNFARILGNYTFESGIGYLTSNDAGVKLQQNPDTVIGPDIAIYSNANTFDELPGQWNEVPPILAVEILSPNDRVSRVNTKISDYLRSGVRAVWLVDHESKTITVYRPAQTHIVLESSQLLDGSPELPGFTCMVSDFFRLPGDPPATPS